MFAALDKRSDEMTAKEQTNNSKTNLFETMILFPRVSFGFAPCVFLFFAALRETGPRKAVSEARALARARRVLRALPYGRASDTTYESNPARSRAPAR